MKASIVCATDFSDNAKNATNWAAFLCKELNYSLYLYHCYHIPVMVNDMPLPMGSETEMEDGLNSVMQLEITRLSELYKGLDIQTKVEPGLATDSILDFASEKGISLIVLGITSRNAAGQVLVGSTAVNVSLNSKIPVLIIPGNARPPMKIANIGLATDFNDLEKVQDMHVFLRMTEKFDATVELVHVSKDLGNTTDRFNPPTLIKGFENLRYSIHNIVDNDVESGLVYFTWHNKIDILTMIHKKHGFFERMFRRSHTGKLAYRINVPLLVLHE